MTAGSVGQRKQIQSFVIWGAGSSYMGRGAPVLCKMWVTGVIDCTKVVTSSDLNIVCGCDLQMEKDSLRRNMSRCCSPYHVVPKSST
jgi:hypothetical protein